MGETAEMMFDGTLCGQCGTHLGRAVGYPRHCRECAKDQKQTKAQANREANSIKKVRCEICNRKVWPIGPAQHKKDAHKIQPESSAQ